MAKIYQLFLLIGGILFYTVLTSNAQSPLDEADRLQLKLTYFGDNYTRPGLSLGANYMFWRESKGKVSKRGEIRKSELNLIWENALSFYHQRRNHVGLLFQSGAGFRRLRKKGAFFGFGLFTGYKRNFLNEDTYEVDAQGLVTKVKLAGQSAMVIGFNTRIGKDFSYGRPEVPWGWFLGTNLYWEFPFGTRLISRNAIELGITCRIIKK